MDSNQLEKILALQGAMGGLNLEKKEEKPWKDCNTWSEKLGFCYESTKAQVKEKAYLFAPLIAVICLSGMYNDCKEISEQSEIPLPTTFLFTAKLVQSVVPFPPSY